VFTNVISEGNIKEICLNLACWRIGLDRPTGGFRTNTRPREKVNKRRDSLFTFTAPTGDSRPPRPVPAQTRYNERRPL